METRSSYETADGLKRVTALRFITCGSVGDGKSTLVGRLLNAQAGTIDVSHHSFSTQRRAFVVADMPGHERFTRDLATAASTADLAVLLVDARKSLVTQSHRHAIAARAMGIRDVVLAVNKIDLVDFNEDIFREIASNFSKFILTLGFQTTCAIPVSARFGDNVVSRSERMSWYTGPTLLEYLESIDVESARPHRPFRLPVQSVNRSNSGLRVFAGTIVSGRVKCGDDIIVLPSGHTTRVKTINGPAGEVDSAESTDAVTLVFTDEVNAAGGDMIAGLRDRAQVADQFSAHLLWMSTERLLPGRSYLMKINNNTLGAAVTELKHQIDVNSLAKLAAKTLSLNEIGVCNLSLTRAVPFDPCSQNRDTGAFILIDNYSNETVAAGTIDFALRRASNIHYQKLAIGKNERSRLKPHRPSVLWFTGLPGAGKSTIANLVEAKLHARGIHTALLDGDNVRHGLNRDLGFTEPDRVENIRRIGEVAKLMIEAGLVVLCSFISPFRAERRTVRALLDSDEFLEIFVDTPLKECQARDPKGLYRRALAGEIKNFTGVDQPYEIPEKPELHLSAGLESAEKLAEQVIDELVRRATI